MAIIVSIIASTLFAIPWAIGVVQTTPAQIDEIIESEKAQTE